MCGFTTILANNPITEDIISKLQRCNQEMSYRGPNEQDIWHQDNIALAHVRLSIIGVDNGHQPIFNENKSLVLVCNGEIYNYKELKADLIKKKHEFQTESDSEVILHLYEEDGIGCLKFLRGMFAFALWDSKKQTLFIARDVAGQKPLYYTTLRNSIVFSSELKTLSKYFLEEKKLNYEVLRQTQKNSYSISPKETYIHQIQKVESGTYLLCQRNQIIEEKRYFNRKVVPAFKGNYAQAITKVRAKLFESVERRLQSEVPVGILLSAGVDSSAIACIAKKLGHEVHVISAGYKGQHDVDERKEAYRLSEEKGFIWHEVELDEETYQQSLESIASVLDEPNGDVAMFAQWGIYKKAKELGFTVLLSGNGGDELFYGYQSHNDYGFYLDYLNEGLYPKIIRKLNHIFLGKKPTIKWVDTNYANRPVNQELMNSSTNPLERSTWFDSLDNDGIEKVYHFLHYAWLTNNCYFLADKLAMAHSIEVRSPFADQDLIEFVDTLPLKYKLPEFQPKQLLKDVLEGIVPKYVLNRKKTGFTPPSNFIKQMIKNYPQAFFSNKIETYPQLITDYFMGFNSKYPR